MSLRVIRPARRRRVLVDVHAAVHTVALVGVGLSATLIVPAVVALGYGESMAPFLEALAAGAAVSVALAFATRNAAEITVREGFLIVALAWLLAAAIGCLPYVFEGREASRVVDALFESMSGFTTTGSSVMTDIEGHDRSLLLWRSMTQWFGGMGIIVLALAILPRLSVGGRQLMQSEAPGPELEKLAPRIRDTARRLWLLYVAFTVAEFVLLAAIGLAGFDDQMDVYNAANHALTTMPTGGFSPQTESIDAFGAAAQWVIVVFMAIAGANFVVWWRVVRRSRRHLARDEEFRVYVAILVVATAVVAVILYAEGTVAGVHGAARQAAFQVVSFVTTTGYASADFALWTPLALVLLFGLLFVGGCAGSTGGGPKVVRHMLAARAIRREVQFASHPQLVRSVNVSGRPVDERALRAALVFLLVYIALFILGVLLLLVDAALHNRALTPFEALSAAATTIGNVGPGFGFLGPFGSFAPFGDLSTVVMIVLMWLGRLELFPVLVLATRSYWRR